MKIFLSALVFFKLTLLSVPYVTRGCCVLSPLKSSLVQQKQKSKYPFFQGVRKYCAEDGLWDYVVTIKGSSITLTSYPGLKNYVNKNKKVAEGTVYGYIKGEQIITKEEGFPSAYCKLKGNTLYIANYQDGYNEYHLCK